MQHIKHNNIGLEITTQLLYSGAGYRTLVDMIIKKLNAVLLLVIIAVFVFVIIVNYFNRVDAARDVKLTFLRPMTEVNSFSVFKHQQIRLNESDTDKAVNGTLSTPKLTL